MRGDPATAGWLPIRRLNGSIDVKLPRRARRLLLGVAAAVQECVDDPSSLAFGRLYGQLDETANIDDPLLRLERQRAIDDLCAMVVESANENRLSDIQAEAWLRVLGMGVSLIAANAEVHVDEDLKRLDRKGAHMLDLLRSLQLLLAYSLDPTLGDLDDPEEQHPGPA